MLGAIVGDIAGSVYEFDNHKSKYFPLFLEDSKYPDDTILTIATAGVLLESYQRLLLRLSSAQNLES